MGESMRMFDRWAFRAWRVLPAIALHVSPALLLGAGVITSADLLLAYVLEAGVLLVTVALLLVRLHGWRSVFHRESVWVAWLFCVAAWVVADHLDVDPWRLGYAVATTAYLAIGTWWLARGADPAEHLRRVTEDAAWTMFLLVVGAVLGFGISDTLARLASLGWAPTDLPAGGAGGVGREVVVAWTEAEWSVTAVPAVIVIVLQTITQSMLLARELHVEEVVERRADEASRRSSPSGPTSA